MEHYEGSYISMTTGKLEDEFDEAWFMCNWLDKYAISDIYEIVEDFSDHGLFNDKGEKVVKAIECMSGRFAINEGVPKEHYDFILRFYEWTKKHPYIHIDKGWKPTLAERVERMIKDNPKYLAIEVKVIENERQSRGQDKE